jgi:CheY-like chemotaxis protein
MASLFDLMAFNRQISSTQGEGTRVEIVLPISESTNTNNLSKLNTAIAFGRKYSDRKLNILIVDDEPALADLVLSWTTVAGQGAVVLHSADDALTLLAAKGFDVLLTDIIMPGTIDGIALAEKANALYPDIKILLMSGYSRETATNRAAMPWPLLIKPFSRHDLEEALEKEFAEANATPTS